MMRFEAVKKRLLVCRVGFEQHLDFVLLLQFAFPVIEGGRSGEEGYTGSQFFGQYFGGEIPAEASSGAVHNTTTASGVFTSRPPHHESGHYITQGDWSLMKRAAERPDFNYFYNPKRFTARRRR